LAAANLAFAENWPQWRGPRGDGTSDNSHVPIRWSEKENIQWKTRIPGKGHSSPVVWGDRVFVTSCLEKEENRVLLCLDRQTGRILWQKTVLTAPLEPKHSLNSYASSTPATDGHLVWVTFLNMPKFEVYCYDFDGKLVWQRSPGEFHSKHGFCSPPVLYKDMIVLNGDQDADAYLVALDKNTGEERWRTDRPNKVRSYCPPLVIDSGGRKQLVLTGSLCTASYDPDTGKQIWIVDGPTEQFVASMVFLPDSVFLSSGFPEYHVMAIRPDGTGNVTKSHVLWHEHCDASRASYVPSPIAHDKYFFLVTDNGFAYCLDAKTGKRLWQHRLGDHHSASPVSAGELLYFPDDDGTTYVFKGSDKFELVSRNKLDDGCRASPAVSDGQIFLRTLSHLYCIGERQEELKSVSKAKTNSNRPSTASNGTGIPISDNSEAWKFLPPADKGAGQPLPAWARTLARTLPRTTAAFLELDYLHRAKSPLDPKLRGMMRWVSAHANRCAYTEAIAAADLRRAGVTDAVIQSLAGDFSAFPDKEKIALVFARQLTSAADTVTDDQVANLIGQYGQKDVVAMVLLLAYANFQDRLVLALNLPPERPSLSSPLEIHFVKKDDFPKPPARVSPKDAGSEKDHLRVNDREWLQADYGLLQKTMEVQRGRAGRIPVPSWESVRPLMPSNYPADKPLRIRWSLVCMGYQPELAAGWSACTWAFAQESEQDRVFEESLFWVITRSLKCFY
jgi:outer membrane protein assembly factor BamB/alkylhydroperoxidase family enzyme